MLMLLLQQGNILDQNIMNINFRQYREQQGMSQEEVASRLRISVDNVRLGEKFPAKVSMGLAMKWLQVLGVDLATAMSEETPPLPGIEPGFPYAELYRRLNLLNQYINETPPLDKFEFPTNPKLPLPHDVLTQIQDYYQKPNVVLTGGFDTGKSHLANSLLGSKNLPESYQPATKLITIIRHLGNRPHWFNSDVWIIDEDFWLDKHDKHTIDLKLLDNRKHCEKHRLYSGSFDILEKYGVHKYDNNKTEIAGHTAIVYLDSPLLKACNLIDLPGYSDQPDEISKDVDKANSATQIADILIYTSLAKGHINGQDMDRLTNLLRLLPTPENECQNFPTLGNLFIVATHAEPSISNTALPNILNDASTRLYNRLDETAIQRRREATNREIILDDVRKQFFTFWTERPDRCQRLFDELTKLLTEYFPESIQCRVDREINAIKNDNKKQYAEQVEQYQQTLANIEESRNLLKEAEANEPARQKDMQQKRNYVRKRIKELGEDTKKAFQKYAESIINVNSIEQTIRKKYNNKKEAQEYVAGYLVDLLQSNLESSISTNSEKLKAEIDDYLEGYPELKLTTKDGIKVSIPFDTKGAFLGGIAGLGAYGALAAWAAGLGNLGGYILVAKLVSLLSALGISIGGGTAAVISFIAVIGGPIVLGIALAAGLASLIFGLFGEAWQSRLAKQIVKYFEEQDICGKLLTGNKQYWQDTATAFDQGAEAVETAWKENLEHQRELVSPDTQSRERIEEIIKKLEVLRDFFADIPWTIQGEG